MKQIKSLLQCALMRYTKLDGFRRVNKTVEEKWGDFNLDESMVCSPCFIRRVICRRKKFINAASRARVHHYSARCIGDKLAEQLVAKTHEKRGSDCLLSVVLAISKFPPTPWASWCISSKTNTKSRGWLRSKMP